MKGKKRSIFLLLLLFLMSIALLLLVFFVFVNRPLAVYDYDVKFMVGDIAGFDIDTSLLTYGRLVPGTTGLRTILINNTYPFPIRVRAYASPSVSAFFDEVPEEYVMQGSSTRMGFVVRVPQNASVGNYSGSVRLFVYK